MEIKINLTRRWLLNALGILVLLLLVAGASYVGARMGGPAIPGGAASQPAQYQQPATEWQCIEGANCEHEAPPCFGEGCGY